jgi:Cytochrome c554 and c-prime
MRSLPRSVGAAFLAAGILVLCAAGALLPGCQGRSAPATSDPLLRARTTPDTLAAQYLGDKACAACHPRQFKDHVASNHALTLGPMTREHLPAGFPRTGSLLDRETGISYTLEENRGRYTISAHERGRVDSRQVDFVLGSGKRANTFVSREGRNAIRELRMSYLADQGRWFVTPGQEGGGIDAIGVQWPHNIAQRCFACHSTVLPESRMVPEERFMGVGCETCHGPGQAHVAAARAGQAPGEIRRLRDWGATRLNNLCAECHRSSQDIDPHNEMATAQTQRMQPYGLMKSACFQKSGDRLSCVTCHDPHRDAETTAEGYERTCRSCHGQPAHSTVCPVNRRNGCVSCHMPPRKLWPGIDIAMADHWIRVFPESRKRGAPKAGDKERASRQ